MTERTLSRRALLGLVIASVGAGAVARTIPELEHEGAQYRADIDQAAKSQATEKIEPLCATSTSPDADPNEGLTPSSVSEQKEQICKELYSKYRTQFSTQESSRRLFTAESLKAAGGILVLIAEMGITSLGGTLILEAIRNRREPSNQQSPS